MLKLLFYQVFLQSMFVEIENAYLRNDSNNHTLKTDILVRETH